MVRPPRDWTLSARFAAVTVVALIAATLVNFAVTFSGPPPVRRPVLVTELLPALSGGGPVPERYGWVSAPAIEPEFAAREGELPRAATARMLSGELGLPNGRVAFASEPGRRESDKDIPRIEAFNSFTLGLRLPDGRWRILRGAPTPTFTPWHTLTLALTLAAALIFAGLALLVARGVVQPLERLGREADSAGHGRQYPITLDGPPEVVRVARAVANMRDRLAAALEQRTTTFTAFAHDMAAPLARLRFRLHDLPPEQLEAAERDLAELSEMIAGIVEYAAVGRTVKPHTRIDALELARTVADSEGALFTAETASAWVCGDALALRRLLTNLVVNARRYGGGGEVVVSRDGDRMVAAVRDRGPGVPADMAERLFEPFFRVEGSRNRDTAGAGLGLAIARAIAEAHGGTLEYRPRRSGGAEFVTSLPLA